MSELKLPRTITIRVGWDGTKLNTLPAKSGSYTLRVEAKDDKGIAIETNPLSQARIIGLSFEGAEPVFLVGDGRNTSKVTLRNVIKIETDSGAPVSIPGAPSASTPAGAPQLGPVEGAKRPAHVFSFERGVGSKELASEEIPSELQKAIDKAVVDKAFVAIGLLV
jgi:hypothetical protein